MPLGQAAAYYRANEPRGEYVLVLGGAAPAAAPEVSLDQAVALVQELTAGGMSKKDAVRQVAAETGIAKNALYAAVV